MNSRIENGTMVFSSKEEVMKWLADEKMKEIYESDGNHIAYFNGETERKIFYPETDSTKRIRESICFDEKVTDYLDIDKTAEFISNCIDVNAIAATDTVALLWDEPIYDENGDIEDYREDTKGRTELMDRTDATDEYVLEVARDLLGCNWTEKSAIVVNVGELVSVAKEIAEECDRDFDEVFKEAVVQTICHEFRHAVYEMTDFLPETENYPADGREEYEVEQYGNLEADFLMHNANAIPYIEKMFSPMEQKQRKGDKKREQEKTEK